MRPRLTSTTTTRAHIHRKPPPQLPLSSRGDPYQTSLAFRQLSHTPPISTISTKSISTTTATSAASDSSAEDAVAAAAQPPPPPPRWLSDIKQRIGKCIHFGMDRQQVRRAGEVLSVLGREWRELVAGREGFLTERGKAGLLRQRVVWGEMDSMAHVNNVTYTRYAESARIEWAYNYAVHIDPKNMKQWSELWTPKGDGLILRSIRTDYKFPMTWPDHISVFHKLRFLPHKDTSSFILDVMILSELHQRPAARCVEDIVVYDYRIGKKIPMRPFMKDAFEQTWREQEEAKRMNGKKIEALENIVRELEKETWDREDAVEEIGGV